MMNLIFPAIGTSLLIAATVWSGGKALQILRDVQAPALIQDEIIFHQDKEPESKPNQSKDSAQTTASYEVIVDRPLFAPTRKASSLEPIATTPIAELAPSIETIEPPEIQSLVPPDGMALSGVIGEETDLVALIMVNETQDLWLRVGDDTNGWFVTHIDPA